MYEEYGYEQATTRIGSCGRGSGSNEEDEEGVIKISSMLATYLLQIYIDYIIEVEEALSLTWYFQASQTKGPACVQRPVNQALKLNVVVSCSITKSISFS